MYTATQTSGVARLGTYSSLARKGEGIGGSGSARQMSVAWQGTRVAMIAAEHAGTGVGDVPQLEKRGA